MGTGLANSFSSVSGLESLAGNIGMMPAGAALAGGAQAMQPEMYAGPEDEPMKYKRTQYNLGDVNTTDSSKPYFGTQSFSPFEEYTLADGGEVPAGPPARNPALQSYLSNLNTKLTAMPTPVQAPAAPASQAPASTPDKASDVANALRFGPFNFGGFNGMGSFFRPGMDSGSVKYDAATKRFSYAGGGGIAGLGAYSDGGRLLKGPGDGVSDDIPAVIHNSDGSEPQEARLADGEFVFPARIVSEIGNGSTEAGARKLYAIMDRIQKDRGRSLKNVAANTKADRHFEGLA
jgi:hypothetical protein